MRAEVRERRLSSRLLVYSSDRDKTGGSVCSHIRTQTHMACIAALSTHRIPRARALRCMVRELVARQIQLSRPCQKQRVFSHAIQDPHAFVSSFRREARLLGRRGELASKEAQIASVGRPRRDGERHEEAECSPLAHNRTTEHLRVQNHGQGRRRVVSVRRRPEREVVAGADGPRRSALLFVRSPWDLPLSPTPHSFSLASRCALARGDSFPPSSLSLSVSSR